MDLGINLSGAEWSHDVSSGKLGVDYFFPTKDALDYFAAKGFTQIRLPISWELLQPTLNGPLNQAYLDQIRTVVAQAKSLGLTVDIDLHNYGSYNGNLIGSAAVPASSFANLWGSVAAAFQSDSNVQFGLMNEPQQTSATVWLGAVNAAIAAIRGAGASQQVLVSGINWDGAASWTGSDNANVIGKPGAIVDPLHNYAFEVHQYLDDTSGTHDWVVSDTIGVQRLQAITTWARANGVPLYLTEFGVANNAPSLTALTNMMNFMQANGDVWKGADYWESSAQSPNDIYSVAPDLGLFDRAQMDVLEHYAGAITKSTLLVSGLTEIDSFTAGHTKPSMTDIVDANGVLQSRTLYDENGNPVRAATLQGDGSFVVTAYAANSTVISTVNTYNSAHTLVSSTQFAADGSAMKDFYASTGAVIARTVYDAHGAETSGWKFGATTITGDLYSNGHLASIEQYDTSWRLTDRYSFNQNGAVTTHQIENADGSHIVDTYDATGTFIVSRNIMSSNWSTTSWTNYDSTHQPAAVGTPLSAFQGEARTVSETATTLHGTSAADTLDGGTGAHTLYGGAGNDTYVVHSSGDVVVELANQGTDTVLSGVSYALTANVENLALTGAASINATGNGLANIINGNAGDNVIDGGAGADTMQGFAGNDTYMVDNSGDRVIEAIGGGNDTVLTSISYRLGTGQEIENLRASDPASVTALSLTGNEFDNTITGNAGDNYIDGSSGNDTMQGLGGNDTYVVGSAGDRVIEAVGGGTDTVQTKISYTLAAGQEIEKLQAYDMTATTALKLTGNEFANTITGGAGNDTLDGAAGADTLLGLGGNDTLTGGAGDDHFVFQRGSGSDIVTDFGVNGDKDVIDISDYLAHGLTPTLTNVGANVVISFSTGERITVQGAQAVNLSTTATGFVAVPPPPDVVHGLATLVASDPVSVAASTLTGDEFANAITGDAGNNIIDGGGGADTMQGLGGNDTYYVDNALDIVKEAVGGGTDTVLTSVSYTLAAGQEIENFQARDATATTALTLTGNEFANKIIGNAGDNIIDGGAGADTMQGLGGNDIYFVDNAGDKVIEAAGGGTDTVLATVSYTLDAGQEIERFRAFDPTSTTALNLTGNEFTNKIVGNAGNNVIDGGGGADNLSGGLGADTFVFRTPGMGTSDATAATILDFSHAQGDRIDLSALDANILQGGNQHFTLHDSGADHVAGAVWLVENGGTTIVNMDTNGDGTADYVLHVATQNAQPLVANDFIF